jgi:hypothetical protein
MKSRNAATASRAALGNLEPGFNVVVASAFDQRAHGQP